MNRLNNKKRSKKQNKKRPIKQSKKRSRKQSKKRSRRQKQDGRAVIDTPNTLDFENIRDIFHRSQFRGTVPINSFSYNLTFYRILREFCDNANTLKTFRGFYASIILFKHNGIVYVIDQSSSPPKKYAVICDEHKKEIPISYNIPPEFYITVPASV